MYILAAEPCGPHSPVAESHVVAMQGSHQGNAESLRELHRGKAIWGEVGIHQSHAARFQFSDLRARRTNVAKAKLTHFAAKTAVVDRPASFFRQVDAWHSSPSHEVGRIAPHGCCLRNDKGF